MNERTHPQPNLEHDRVMDIVDEFSRRLLDGEQPEIESYVQKAPDLEREIRETLETIRTLHSMDSCEISTEQPRPVGAHSHCLGDFRLLREIGRGGMGIVYEAEQISLGRMVAVKVLPYAAMVDSQRMQRFKNEVAAVARLDHPNIVPIYAVACDRGVHHYAMRLVDGCSLNHVIQELRRLRDSNEFLPEDITTFATVVSASSLQQTSDSDSQFELDPALHDTGNLASTGTRESRSPAIVRFRTIAKLVSVIADALDHAHERGIVHRDIKPANLLLDTSGNPWITDFGLAQMESNHDLTMTGDILGTTRYMSPEQVLGKRIGIDHRADIFSLGVTLYEFIALQHPFPADDREELLHKIVFERPSPLSRINATIPLDLETIVLKCLEKNTEDRYSTANELANDLRRFAQDEPICACRPTTMQRLARVVRKRPATAGGLVIGFLLIAAISIGAAFLLNRQKNLTQQALIREQDLTTRLDDSLGDARRNLNTARAAIQKMLEEVSSTELRYTAQTDTIRKRLLAYASELYAEMLENSSGDQEVRMSTAEMWLELGELEELTGRSQSSEIAYANAIRVLETFPEANPTPQQIRLLARACLRLANQIGKRNLSYSLNKFQRAEELLGNLLIEMDNPSEIGKSAIEDGERTEIQKLLVEVKHDYGMLLLELNQSNDAVFKLEEALGHLRDQNDPYSRLAAAEIELALARDDPDAISQVAVKLTESGGFDRQAKSMDHRYMKRALEFAARLQDRLNPSRDLASLSDLNAQITDGWKELAYFYPTSHLIRSQVVRSKLESLKLTSDVGSPRAGDVLDVQLELTNERPTPRNIETLLELIRIDIKSHDNFLKQNLPATHENVPLRRSELNYAKKLLSDWEPRLEKVRRVARGKAIAIGGPNTDTLTKVVSNENSELFVLGTLEKGAWLDPNSPQTRVQHSINMLAKYNSNGLPIKQIDVIHACGGRAMCLILDSKSNVLVGGNDFIAKFDSRLDFVWKKQSDRITAITCDKNDDVIACGTAVSQTASQGDESPVFAKNEHHGFVTKVSSNGDPIWTWKFNSIGDSERIRCIAADPEGNLVIGGGSEGPTSFGTTATGIEIQYDFRQFEKPSSTEGFVAKLSPDGDTVWVRHHTGAVSRTYAIICPGVDSIIFTVQTQVLGDKTIPTFNQNSIDFDSEKSYPDHRDLNQPFRGGYVFTYDRNGSITRVPYSMAAYKAVYPKAICVDARGHIFLAGFFWSIVAFEEQSKWSQKDGFTGGVSFKANVVDGYLVELDSDTKYVNAWVLSGPRSDRPTSLASDPAGRIIMTGEFMDDLTTPTGDELGAAGGQDGYLIILEPLE